MNLYRTVIASISLIALTTVGAGVIAAIERHKWESFKAAHQCRPLTYQRAGITGWQCSDGNTYWRR